MLANIISNIKENNLAKAEKELQKILKITPKNFEINFLLGITYGIQGSHLRASVFFKNALTIDPNSSTAMYNLAKSLMEIEDHNEALKYHDKVSKIDSKNPDVWLNYGISLFKTEKNKKALAYIKKSIELNSNNPNAYSCMGEVLMSLDNHEEALYSLDKAIKIDRNNPIYFKNKGVALLQLKKYDVALEYFEISSKLGGEIIELKINKALCFYYQKKYNESIKCSLEVIDIKPNCDALNIIGNCLNSQNNYSEALIIFNKAIEINSKHKSSWLNKAVVLNSLRKFDEAEECFLNTIKLDKEDAHSHFEYALYLLRNGDYEKGWIQYEYRWKWKDFTSVKRLINKPQWTGEKLPSDNKLFIHSEQGLGDTIQFCRYLTKILELSIEVIFEVDRSLRSILEESYPGIRIITRGEPIPEFNFHCPLMSLPLVFKTVLINIPNETNYLKCNKEKLEIWKDRIQTKNNIGICWRGNLLHANYDNRSISLSSLTKSLPEYNIYALQKDITNDEKNELIKNNIKEFKTELIDFSDTAAYCSQMDLIITIDTSVAHLACSIGMRVWILLPFIPDFRWFWDINNSPWYPTAKIYRQTNPGDWDSVISNVVSDLKNFNFFK